jgi:hypothetical protein
MIRWLQQVDEEGHYRRYSLPCSYRRSYIKQAGTSDDWKSFDYNEQEFTSNYEIN